MYTPITPSVSYGEKIIIGLGFDINSFNTLVEVNIDIVNTSINRFKRSKGKINKDSLMNKIGIPMEIIERSVYFEALEKEIKINPENKAKIKKLLPKVDKLIGKLGEHDYDFITMSSTQRARPTKEFLEFVTGKKK